MVNFFPTSPFQTKKIGEILGQEILKTKGKHRALILGLKGELGSGKTTFLQGLAKGLKIKKKILSPTFVIVKRFPIPQNRKISLRAKRDLKFKNFYHIDCYRLQKARNIISLGFKDMVSDSKNIIAIEWVERISKLLPKGAIVLAFKIISPKERKITYSVLS